MADEPQAKAASETTTAAPASGTGTPLNVGDLTVEDLDQAQTAGSKPAEAPIVEGGGKGQEGVKSDDPPPAAKTEDPPSGEQPAKIEPDPPKGEVVEETRTPEEIETAVAAAIEEVKAAGGDQAAQDEAAQVARQPLPKEPAAPAKVEEPAKEPEDKARRFRVKDPIAQAALDLYKVYEGTDEPITLAEAEKRVRGGDAPAKTADVVTPDTAKVVSDLEAEVAEIETKIKAAAGDERLYDTDIATLNIEHTKKVQALESAKRDLRDEQRAIQTAADAADAQWKKNAKESRARAVEMFPDVKDKDSALGKAVDERVAEMQDPSHPDHNMLYGASAAEMITIKVAQERNIAPVAKKAAAPTKPEKVVIPAKTPAPPPVSGALSSAASAQTVTEDAKKQLEHLRTSDDVKLEDLDAVMGDKGKIRLAHA